MIFRKRIFIVLILFSLQIPSLYCSSIFLDNRNSRLIQNFQDPLISTSPIASNMSYEWIQSYTLNYSVHAQEVTIDSNDYIYIAGRLDPNSASRELERVFLLKYNEKGTLLWDIEWIPPLCVYYRDNLYVSSISSDSENNIYIGGYTKPYYQGPCQIFLVKFSEDGLEQWNLTWGGSGSDWGGHIAIDSHDNIAISGTTDSYGGSDEIFICLFNSSGSLIWQNMWGYSYSEMSYGIGVDNNDNIIILGEEEHSDDDKYYCLIKYNNSGYQLKNETILLKYHSSYLYSFANVKFSSSGEIYVLLDSYMDELLPTNCLIKYNSNFSQQWNKTWIDFENSFYGSSYRGSLDSQENICVSGVRYRCLKYDHEGNHLGNLSNAHTLEICTPINIALDSKDNWYIIAGSRLIKYNKTIPSFIPSKSPKFKVKNLYAIIIGIEFYSQPQYWIDYCNEDAVAMIRFLRETCNIPTDNIIYLGGRKVTKNNIQKAFDRINEKIKPEDELLFYYSGHGTTYNSRSAICPYNSIPSNPENYVSTFDLDAMFDSINCIRQYIILDSCNSGGFVEDFRTISWLGDNNTIVIASSKKNEYSYETPELGHGVFTYYFLESQEKAEDINSDGFISLEEKFNYTYEKTLSYSYNNSLSQTPQWYDSCDSEIALSPSIISSFIRSGNNLSFNFEVLGSGQIYSLNISHGNQNFDQCNNTSSETGFGEYSGTLTELYEIPLEFILEIKGYRYLTISIEGKIYSPNYGGNVDYELILIILVCVAVTGILISIAIAIKSSARN